MPLSRQADDVLNINVGGKRYTVRRADLIADSRSRLAEWFRSSTSRPVCTDKGGNIFLDRHVSHKADESRRFQFRDPKTFRHILAYLRLKKENVVPSLALPSKPDELAKLIGECDALKLAELKELAVDLLEKYRRTDEQHYVTSYVQSAMTNYENWSYERERYQTYSNDRVMSPKGGTFGNSNMYDDWEGL